MASLIRQIKKTGLMGMSGSCYPVWLKWQQVKKSKSRIKYIICNGAEGELKTHKDYFILKKYPKQVISGIKLALQETKAKTAYLYLNKKYYRQLKPKLIRLTHNLPIELFEKPEGYLSGEETVILNIIESQKKEPRLKPPYPTTSGLFGKPTLINNLETFYWVSQIAKNQYNYERFFSLEGKVKNKGVFKLPFDFTIKDILTITGNRPWFDFFVQVGGGASGKIFLPEELDQPILNTLGSIIVFDKKTTNPVVLMCKWAKFFFQENCDLCSPCREGTYRILEILEKQELNSKDKETLFNLFNLLEKASLCPFGRNLSLPFKSALQKLC
ncbi:hypothetical protein FJ208_01030 [Candidatus Gribaldobacteria bacterium]|nr:hypothetical protein [Candidatus Gribaldobacteria bacterium]